MESTPATRAQSLQLLKSKLRATGRRRLKASHRIAATLEEVTPNQQETQPSEPFVANVATNAITDELTLLSRLAAKEARPEADEDFKLPAGETSTPQASCNQDEVSVAELKHEFAALTKKSAPPTMHQPNELVAVTGATPAPVPTKLKSYTKTVIQWSCDKCKRECIPVREESRCLCGHRYKEHPSSVTDPRVKSPAGFRAFACTSTKCSCKAFFYVVAEGAWILRCRCKHRHTDHDPGRKPFACTKAKCGCQGFDSPWVCNCDHPWSSHHQHRVEKRFDPLQLLQAQCVAPELNTVHRTDLLASPLDLRL